MTLSAMIRGLVLCNCGHTISSMYLCQTYGAVCRALGSLQELQV